MLDIDPSYLAVGSKINRVYRCFQGMEIDVSSTFSENLGAK